MSIRVAPLACALALASYALRLGAYQQPTFRSGVRTVAIYATVNDQEGRLVPDLQRNAFRILDNGRPTAITVFSNDVQRITVAMMLDMSNSMIPKVLRVRDSTERFIDAIAPGDCACIGTFGWEVAISPVLTDDKRLLWRVLHEELWPGGPTPLWRALLAAMTSLETETGRRVVLVLTDGNDADYTYSRPTARDVTRRAVRDAFMVYAIGMERAPGAGDGVARMTSNVTNTVILAPGSVYSGGLSDEIIDVVEETGGGHFELKSDADLGDTFAQVAEELRHQYLLGFSPAALDGKVHKLEVQVTLPGCRVRARKSYVAGREG
jgi:VWFA-related protein